MSATPPLEIGLVLSGHVASCPRAVKFADALHARGVAVRVFALQHSDWVSELDDDLLAQRAWPATIVAQPDGNRRRLLAAEQRIARAAWRLGLRTRPVAHWGEARSVRALLTAAAPFRPRVWMGFNVPGMLAADRLSRDQDAILITDVEDDHVGILAISEAAERQRLACMIGPMLHRARHRITTSLEMRDMLTARYGVDFQVLHNVPVLDEVAELPLAERRRSLYWCSQTVGPDRGLEEFLRIFALLPQDITLSLLGRVSDAYRADLLRRALALGVGAKRIVFLPPVTPAQMLPSARVHLLGLALENTYTENHQVCLTNKVFDYLAAGLPVIFTRTPSQERLAGELGAAACLIDLDQPERAAELIRPWLDDDQRCAAAIRAAREQATRRYCWQVEQRELLSALAPYLGAAIRHSDNDAP